MKDISLEKIDLAKKILDINDPDAIRHIKAAIESSSADWYDELPEEVKLSIERGLTQSANGDTIPHNQVMKKYEK